MSSTPPFSSDNLEEADRLMDSDNPDTVQFSDHEILAPSFPGRFTDQNPGPVLLVDPFEAEARLTELPMMV